MRWLGFLSVCFVKSMYIFIPWSHTMILWHMYYDPHFSDKETEGHRVHKTSKWDSWDLGRVCAFHCDTLHKTLPWAPSILTTFGSSPAISHSFIGPSHSRFLPTCLSGKLQLTLTISNPSFPDALQPDWGLLFLGTLCRSCSYHGHVYQSAHWTVDCSRATAPWGLKQSLMHRGDFTNVCRLTDWMYEWMP